MSEIYRFVDRLARRNYANVHLLFAREPQARNNARPKVNQGPIRAWNSCIRIEHLSAPRSELASSRDDFEYLEIPRKAGTFVALHRACR